MGWVAANTPDVVDKKPEVLSGWMEPSYLSLTEDVDLGDFLGPVRLGEVWAVAEVTELEPAEVIPLDRCRDRVLQAMKGEQMRDAMQNAVERLKADAQIEIMDEAEGRVQTRLEAWLGRPIAAQ
jgi:hypothetical protein